MWAWLRRRLGRQAPSDRHREIDEELAAHIDARIDYLVAKGVPAREARAEALRRFGDFQAGRAALHAEPTGRSSHPALGDQVADSCDDLRYIGRTLRRQPAFTSGVAVTMALGLGINSAVFRVADYMLFRPPSGVADPSSVRTIEANVVIGKSAPQHASQFDYPDAARLRVAPGLVSASAYANTTLRDPDGRDVAVTYTDGAFFRTLGVQPARGRSFDAAEGRPGSGIAVAVISDRLWRDRFAALPIGALPRLTLGSKTSTIIGVMPPGFVGLDADPVDVWLPFGIAEIGRTEVNGVVIPWYQSTMMRAIRVVARLPVHAPEGAIRTTLSAALTTPDDATDGVARTAELRPIVPVGGRLQNQTSNALLGRLGLVAMLVLVIACANVINLLLARGIWRRREIAIRLAIGASRSRIARLVIGESVILALLGGLVAAASGLWTSQALRQLLFPDARWTAATFDGRTLAFTAVLAVAAGLAAGLLPAVQSVAPDLVSGLKRGWGRGAGKTRFARGAFVVVQIAVSLALIVVSGLLVRSMIRLNEVPLGFDPRGLVIASTGRTLQGLSIAHGVEATDVASRIPADVASARSVAIASVVPFGVTTVSDVRVIGASYTPDSPLDTPRIAAVSATYFEVMRTRVVDGRGFSDRDTAGSEPVSVVNASMAQRYFGGKVPSGACVLPVGLPCARIVGVVEDVRDSPGGDDPPMRYYLPLPQVDQIGAGVIVRTTEARARSAAALMRSMFPASQRGVTVEVVADRVGRALRPWRMATLLIGAFGVLALAIAGAGVYSVMSYMASERAHEIGVRVVLGAAPADIRHLMLGEGLRLSLAGGTAGVVATVIVGQYLRALLFGVSPFDPAVYALGLLGLMVSTMAAVVLPAIRASRLDSTKTMRAE